MRLVFAVCLWALALFPVAAAEIPPKQGVVTDRLGVLSATQREQLQDAAAKARAAQGELSVLAQSHSGESDHRAYATRVFNQWQLGQAPSHRGILIYLALDDRAAEIILGEGIDQPVQVAIAERIMQQTMIPRLRQGKVGEALQLAGQQAVRELLQADMQASTSTVLSSSDADSSIQPLAAMPRERLLVEADPAEPRSQPPAAPAARGYQGPWLLFIGIAGSLIGLLGWPISRFIWRNRPPQCERCRRPMKLLDEVADDDHLSAPERSEERIKSVNYDVWHCALCQQVQKRRFGRWFSGYSRCPRCQGLTKQSKETTLTAATRHSTGLMQIDETCQHCGFHQRSTRTLSRLPPPSTSSRGGSRIGGGGRSAGRGASGRW